MNITFTTAAAEYIKKMVEKTNSVGFRISVKKTGCSGYAYLPAVIEKINEHDQTVTISSGVKIFVDTAWLDLLQDLQVDYVEEDKLGLKQKRLVFKNPKEGNRCGCGESFQIDTTSGE